MKAMIRILPPHAEHTDTSIWNTRAINAANVSRYVFDAAGLVSVSFEGTIFSRFFAWAASTP
jgi:hypothetical protein